MNINVLVFENSSTVREHIALLLASDPELSVSGMLSSVNNCVREAAAAKADIILMDINVSGMNNMDVIRLLKQGLPNIQVIIQTTSEDNSHIYEAICAGASGYLLKRELDNDLVNALKIMRAGGTPMSPFITRKVLNIMKQAASGDQVQVCNYGLSKREKEILSYIVHGLSYKMIASKLFIAYETVRSHMKSIYGKLQVDSLTAVVAKAIHEHVV